jgi:hypothetical protein
VSKLKTKDTFIACLGYGPMYKPTLALESNFGIVFSDASLIFRAYTGQPNVWLDLRLGATSTPENISDGQVPSLLSGKELLICCVFLNAYGQKLVVTAAGHLALAGRSYFLAGSYRSLIIFSAFTV